MMRNFFINPYVLAILAVLVAFGVQTLAGPYFGSVFALVPFLFAVMFAARAGGVGPASVALVLGYAAAAYFFMRPGTFVVRGRDDLAALAVYLLVGLSTSLLAESLHRVRRNAEQSRDALRASEQRFRAMADSAPVMIWMSDQTKACTWFNRPWLEFRGRAMEQELGFGWAEGIHPEDVDRCIHTYNAAFDRRESFRMEYRLRGHDGQYRWVMDQGIPLAGASGFVGYIGSAVDIHEKTEAEKALLEADRRKDDFLAMLAHELRNPLTTIQYANSVSRLTQAGHDTTYADMIDAQVKHLARLIDDLLDVARITKNRIELQTAPLDGAEVVARAIEAARPLVERRRHHLRVHIDAGPLPLVADATRLEQIVQNLLSNAAKYTPPGGEIEVAARREGAAFVLSVKDNGAGMSSELVARIFEPFTQGETTIDRSQGGLGIGLTLVRKLVELHGGTVTAHSGGLGQGSEFIVRLPLAASWRPPQAADHSEVATAQRSLRILLVEDNVDSALGLARLLEHAGHVLAICHSGGEALDAARRHDAEVILLDIGLPGVDGYEVARRFRRDADLGEVTIIGISGYGQASDRRRGREAGFDHHLVKPIDFEVLTSFLARVASRRERAAI
jgi:PAS domain S-box-containing protein